MTPSARAPRRAAPESSARDRLLQAAVEIFERKGYASASVREIVEHAGLTKPALYYYFQSKEGILVAVLELAVGKLDQLLGEETGSSGSARSRLADICARLVVTSHSRSSLVRVAHAVFFGPREDIPPFDFSVVDRIVQKGLRRIVADGVAAGEIRRAAAADMIHAMQALLMLAIGQHADGRRETLGQHEMRRLVDLVFDGAGVTPRLVKGASL
jgi:AcrR family transcriptional regulator